MSFFRSLFGPSQKEIWSQIAYDIGGRYKDGGFWERDYIKYHYAEWEIILDTFSKQQGKSSVTYTRMRAPFANRDGLYFKIYREGLFSGLSKFFGMQDIQVGDEYFDENFIIQGNSQERISQLLHDEDIKALIERNEETHFSIRDNEGVFNTTIPNGVDILYFECRRTIKNQEQLKDLFDLFALTLDRLVDMDSAYPDNPNIHLK